jgi:lipoprotein-anchoring transpeptidase ErfK/SrfK
MRAIAAALGLGLCLALVRPDGAAAERVEVRVSISRQSMEVFHEGRKLFTWPVSTAKAPKVTPTGIWTSPGILSRNHRSRLYNNAPMPWRSSTTAITRSTAPISDQAAGQPASHGCVRLHPDNARILFEMVKAEGMQNARVTVFK